MASDEFEHLAGPGMPAQGEFRKDYRTLDADFKGTSRTLDQLDRCVRKLPLDLGRQTGSPGLVVSNDTILNSDVHHGSLCRIGTS